MYHNYYHCFYHYHNNYHYEYHYYMYMQFSTYLLMPLALLREAVSSPLVWLFEQHSMRHTRSISYAMETMR